VAPLSMYEEKNTANNMPAQCESMRGRRRLQVHVSWQGRWQRRTKAFLFQATPSVLTKDRLLGVPEGEGADARHRGVPALSLAIVIGGTSADFA